MDFISDAMILSDRLIVCSTAWAMSALATVKIKQNDLESAVNLLSESLDLHRDTLGETHMKTLACYYRLAWICHRMGELQRSEYVCLMSEPPRSLM